MKKLLALSILTLSLCSFGTTPFKVKEREVTFKINNQDLNSVKIEITDLEGRKVFSEVLEGESKIGKLFNFENANPNTYTIIVEDGDITYRKEIVID